jgi:preprotein translocase subunit SecG
MISVIIAIHLMLVIAMIGVVLLQKSEGGGLVSSSSGFLTGRGTANVLTRTTALLAAGFFATSLALSFLAAHERAPISVIPGGGTPAKQAPGPGTPPPVRPLNSGGNNGLLNELGGGAQSANTPARPGSAPSPAAPSNPAPPGPAAPASPASPAPSAPQVPQSH